MIALKFLPVSLFILLEAERSLAFPTSAPNCPTTVNLEKDTIHELLKITSASSEDDKEFRESVGCAWKNKGLVSEDGVLIVDNFRKALTKEFRLQFSKDDAENKVYEVLKFCKNVKGKNPGETSTKMVHCIGRWKVQAFIDNEREQFNDDLLSSVL